MKKTIGIIAASAFAIAAISAPVAADQRDFGKQHKDINAGAVQPYENVGAAMKGLFEKPWGQAKKDAFFDDGN